LTDTLKVRQQELVLKKLPLPEAHAYYELLRKRARQTRILRAIALVSLLALGYAYRRDARSLGSFVGSAPAAWLLRAGRRAADAAVAEAVRRSFGVRVARITRVAYPRSYLIFAPGELRGFGAHLADPAGPVHFAGAEASELPSFMEGAVRAGERAAADLLASV